MQIPQRESGQPANLGPTDKRYTPHFSFRYDAIIVIIITIVIISIIVIAIIIIIIIITIVIGVFMTTISIILIIISSRIFTKSLVYHKKDTHMWAVIRNEQLPTYACLFCWFQLRGSWLTL